MKRGVTRLCALSISFLVATATVPVTYATNVFASESTNRTTTSSGLTVWAADGMTKLFRATVPDAAAASEISLLAARNEVRAGQVGIRAGVELHELSVSASSLTGPGGAQIAASNISARFIDFIHLKQHTDLLPVSEQLLAPDGSMDYPDRITNDTTMAVLPANTTQPVWYSVYVPVGTLPGLYTGTVSVQSSEGNTSVPVKVRVYDVTLPDGRESTYKVDNWFSSAGWEPVAMEALRYQYGITEFSDDWWTVMTHFAQYMKKHRNNTIWVDPIGYLEPDVQIDANGEYTFDWTKFDRFVQLFIDEGAMKELHGSSLMMKVGDRFQIRTLQNVNSVPQMVQVPAQSAAAEAWLAVYLPALKAHLSAKGWLDLYYQSGGDEPINDQDREDDNWFYGKVRSLASGIRTIEANFVPTYDFEDTLDVQVVKQSNYDYESNYFKIRQDFGQEVWLYICNYPTWEYLVRNIDTSLVKTVLPHWYTFRHGMDGYLHWGFNFWNLNSASGNQAVTASSSREENGWSTAHLTDGVISSLPSSMGWSSSSSPNVNHTEWITVDLGASTEVRKVTMFPRDDGTNRGYGFPVDFTVQVSDDNVNWTTVISQSGHPQPTVYDEAPSFSFVPQHARYVKFEGTNLRSNPHDGGAYRMELAEIAVYGMDDVLKEADTPTPGDRWLVYPDKANLGLFESIRGEAELEGIQDRELLTQLAAVNPDLAQNIAEAIIYNGTNYNRDANAITMARKVILDNLTNSKENETFIDEMNDFSKIYERSTNLVIDGSYPDVIAENDTGRIRRTAGSDEYIVYNRFNIRSFTAKLYYESSREMKFYASPDNRNWTLITATADTPVQTTAPWYRVHLTADNIPWGTNYLKVVFSSTNAHDWVPQLGEIEIVSGHGGASQPVVLIDSMDNFRWMDSFSANLVVDGSYADTIAAGDTGRVRRKTNTDESFVYKRSNIISFKAALYYEGSAHIKLYASANGSSWTPLTLVAGTPVAAPGGSPWFSQQIEVPAMPPGTQYVKVVLPATNTYAWAPQIGEIRIVSAPN